VPYVIKAVLGHTHLHDPIESVYNRTRYIPEHRAALQQLADYYDQIII
jgi:hypothetical protein